MAEHVLAVQLYTVRSFTKTPPEFAEALKRVRRIGYRAVQLSAHGPIEAGELKRILRTGTGYPSRATPGTTRRHA